MTSSLLHIRARPSQVAGLPIRRILPSAAKQMVGPFIFMDQGGPIDVQRTGGGGVPEHPHAGLATFTYSMASSQLHRDSAGHTAVIAAGDIALMTAGRGITHEELPDPDDTSQTTTVHFAQMWLALPDDKEDMAPAFELHKKDTLPVVTLGAGRVRVAMGRAYGVEAPTTCHTPTLFLDVHVAPGHTLDLPQAEELGVMVLEGDGRLDDEVLQPHDLYVLQEPEKSGRLSSTHGLRALVFGGDRFSSPRVIGGSFVASSRPKLQQWMQEARQGRWPRIQR